jgi:hypothetical protein
MGAPEQSPAENVEATCPCSEQNAEGHERPTRPGRHRPSNYCFTETYVGAIRAGADAKRLEPEGVIAVLTEITLDQIRMKRKCSLAISNLISADLENAQTALQSLNPAENPLPADIDEVRFRLLKRARQARSPEHIEKLHNALQTAAIIR